MFHTSAIKAVIHRVFVSVLLCGLLVTVAASLCVLWVVALGYPVPLWVTVSIASGLTAIIIGGIGSVVLS